MAFTQLRSRTMTVLCLLALSGVFFGGAALAQKKGGGKGGGSGGDTAYTITELVPASGMISTWASAINNSGGIAGYMADGFAHAAYWKVDADGRLLAAVALPELFPRSSRANAISNYEEIVGSSTVGLDDEGDSISRAVLWKVHADGTVAEPIDLGTLGGHFIYSGARGINDFGGVVGTSAKIMGKAGADSTEVRAVLWLLDAEGAVVDLIDLTPFGPETFSYAHDINNQGQIVGESDGLAYLWELQWDEWGDVVDVTATRLGTPGGQYSSAHAINEWGDVVGTSHTADGEVHAFLWRDGVMMDLGALAADSRAFAINDLGHVVGYASVPKGQYFETHAVLWTSGVITDLSKGGGNDWAMLHFANGIDSDGRIVGAGLRKAPKNNWEHRGYVLTPR